MKFSRVTTDNIIQAGFQIDSVGVPDTYLSKAITYWVLLPNGKEYPFKYLARVAFSLASSENDHEIDFVSKEEYRQYFSDLGFPITEYKEGFNFISQDDIDHLARIGGKPYRKLNDDNRLSGQLLKPLVRKINIWAKRSLVENFSFKADHKWQWSGTFQNYIWIRIYRPATSKKVFFIVGATGKGLFIKLDCQRSNHTSGSTKPLPSNIRKAFDEYLKVKKSKDDYHELNISSRDLTSLSWDDLIEKTQDYIYTFASLYDALEDLVVKPLSPDYPKSNSLFLFQAPEHTKTRVSLNRTFEGREIDWNKKQKVSRIVGAEGESLVLEHERNQLKEWGLHENVKRVRKNLDGAGYDITSFNKEGEEIHIEVKTTEGSALEPFYMSLNEIEYYKKHPEGYFLYRLYEFRIDKRTSKFYILSPTDFEEASLSPIQYEISFPKR